MYRATGFLIALLISLPQATASLVSIGPAGINSAGLTLPDPGNTPLTGDNVTIGQVEDGRPGKRGVDTDANSNQFVVPTNVFIKAGGAVTPNVNLAGGHATTVAGIIISTDDVDDSVPTNGDAPRGVAINANLWSSAYVSPGTAYDDVLLTTDYIASVFPMNNNNRTKAINHSWGKEQDPIGPLDGSSLLTLGMDWISRRYDVLQVFAGNEGLGGSPIPTDNYNGMTIVYSVKAGDGVFREMGNLNVTFEDAAGLRTSVSLVAPGGEIETADPGATNPEVIHNGTSIATPHVTGAIALLHEYANYRITQGSGPWVQTGPRQHEVIKAVLMNSADKIKDPGNGKYLGMTRTVLKSDGSTWLGSLADTMQEIPLDLEMGAGHLNVARAITQFAPGQFDASNAAIDPRSAGITEVVAMRVKSKSISWGKSERVYTFQLHWRGIGSLILMRI